MARGDSTFSSQHNFSTGDLNTGHPRGPQMEKGSERNKQQMNHHVYTQFVPELGGTCLFNRFSVKKGDVVLEEKPILLTSNHPLPPIAAFAPIGRERTTVGLVVGRPEEGINGSGCAFAGDEDEHIKCNEYKKSTSEHEQLLGSPTAWPQDTSFDSRNLIPLALEFVDADPQTQRYVLAEGSYQAICEPSSVEDPSCKIKCFAEPGQGQHGVDHDTRPSSCDRDFVVATDHTEGVLEEQEELMLGAGRVRPHDLGRPEVEQSPQPQLRQAGRGLVPEMAVLKMMKTQTAGSATLASWSEEEGSSTRSPSTASTTATTSVVSATPCNSSATKSTIEVNKMNYDQINPVARSCALAAEQLWLRGAPWTTVGDVELVAEPTTTSPATTPHSSTSSEVRQELHELGAENSKLLAGDLDVHYTRTTSSDRTTTSEDGNSDGRAAAPAGHIALLDPPNLNVTPHEILSKLLRVLAINAHSFNQGQQAALFDLGTKIAHTCLHPNVVYSSDAVKTVGKWTAVQDIPPDSLLLACYLPPHLTHVSAKLRRRILYSQKGFVCQCTVCRRAEEFFDPFIVGCSSSCGKIKASCLTSTACSGERIDDSLVVTTSASTGRSSCTELAAKTATEEEALTNAAMQLYSVYPSDPGATCRRTMPQEVRENLLDLLRYALQDGRKPVVLEVHHNFCQKEKWNLSCILRL
ncbi:unnamed protein product [Amoebophrya sp. A120]|nr:unnamed protein product [Amoebophrya sp. A120]|eukprot:GSA120T00013437001.1